MTGVADRAVDRDVLDIDTALQVIFDERHSLFGIAMGVLGDAASAQDVVQDAMESVLRVRPQFADDANAVRYARVAVVNKARSVLRKRATARRHLLRAREDVEAPADERLLVDEEHREVLAHFGSLPTRQREALTLRYFASLADDEIADAMSVSVLTVRSNISRGLATLGRLLKEDA